MPRKYKLKNNKLWTNCGLARAIAERDATGTPMRKLSDKYNVPIATLHRYLNYQKEGKTIPEKDVRGCKTVFTAEEERQLTNCITELARIGFAPSLNEIGDVVRSYVEYNDHERGKRSFHYKNVLVYPGPDWMRNFLKCNKLSLKQATKLSIVRHNATRNPFIVYHFYEIVAKALDDLEIGDRPDLIWNADETGLPHEPKKCNAVSQKGQKTLQIVTGADRENVMVLAACSGSGKVLPPMIVNQGQHVQSTWQPNIDSKHEFYPWQYANSKGWMTSETFFKWFKKFEEKTRTLNEAGEVEPRVLIYDGQLSHIWFETLKYAQDKSCIA